MDEIFLSGRLSDAVCVLVSDEDQLVMEELIAGMDADGNLVAAVEHNDYEDEHYNSVSYLTVSREDAEALAREWGVTVRELPEEIYDSMEQWRETANPTLSQVRDCFKAVYDLLLDAGCHIRISRIAGHKGYTPC